MIVFGHKPSCYLASTPCVLHNQDIQRHVATLRFIERIAFQLLRRVHVFILAALDCANSCVRKHAAGRLVFDNAIIQLLEADLDNQLGRWPLFNSRGYQDGDTLGKHN
jgi:hypothetical protein